MIFAKGAYVEVKEKRCLNLIHHGVECSHCIGHCPSNAIIFDKDHLYLQKDKCSGCGLCFSDCPTEVFSSKQWDETTIAKDIGEEEWKITEFFCDRHTSPYKKDKSRDRGAVQIPACLSSVSKGAWYEIGLKTEVEIHLDQCNECPMSEAIARLEYNLSVAAEWLAACGQDASFSYIQQGCQGKQKKNLLAIETGLKVTSRRDLFVSLFNKGQQIAGKASGGKNTFPEELDSTMRNSCLPDWQRRLAEVFEKNRKESTNSAYWPSIRIDSNRCMNCGMCSRFCPSGTLQITVKDGSCNHHFTSGLCLDCRTCQLFCPQEAISRDREKVEKPFETVSIYNTLTGSCRNCESTTAHHARTLCYWCEEATASDNELKNSFRKLFLGMSS